MYNGVGGVNTKCVNITELSLHILSQKWETNPLLVNSHSREKLKFCHFDVNVDCGGSWGGRILKISPKSPTQRAVIPVLLGRGLSRGVEIPNLPTLT